MYTMRHLVLRRSGFKGLIWPGAPEILARAAFDHNIPFILSTVSTSSIETIGEITEGRAWFQLYHPAEPEIRDSVIKRAAAANYPVLVLLCDACLWFQAKRHPQRFGHAAAHDR